MRKLALAIAAAAALAVPATASAIEVKVPDPTPNGQFSDDLGNAGYVEADTDERAVRACNENEETPGGDNLSGYVYVNPNGEKVKPTYGNTTVGAADADGEGVHDGNPKNGTEEDDCP